MHGQQNKKKIKNKKIKKEQELAVCTYSMEQGSFLRS
jgi:hypothetical protein